MSVTIKPLQVTKQAPRIRTAEDALKEYIPEGPQRAPKRPVEIGIRLFAYISSRRFGARSGFRW